MNRVWLFLTLTTVAMTLDTRLWERGLDLFVPGERNRTRLCPPMKPESCDCGKFQGKDSTKYFQCVTDPLCEHCAQRWSD